MSKYLTRFNNIPFFTILTALVISIFYAVTIYYSYNFPLQDDSGDGLRTVSTFLSENKPFSYLLKNHSEHRVVFYRLLYILDNMIFGGFNYIRLIFYGNLSILVLFVMIIKNFSFKINSLETFTIALILFVPIDRLSNWALCAVSSQWPYVFIFAAILLLKHKTNSLLYFVLAVLSSALALLTFGNGIAVIPICILFLVLNKWKAIYPIIYSSFAIGLVYLYFLNLDVPSHRPELTELLRYNFFDLVGFCIILPVAIFRDFISSNFILVMLGAFISGVFLYVFFRNWKSIIKLNKIYFFLAMILTVGLVSQGRAASGLHYALIGRYQIVSSLFIAIWYCFILVDESVNTKNIKYSIVIIGLFLFFNRYSNNICDLENRVVQLKKEHISFLEDYDIEKSKNTTLIKRCEDLGYFDVDKGVSYGDQFSKTSETFSVNQIDDAVESEFNVREKDDLIIIRGFSYFKEYSTLGLQKKLVAFDVNRNLYFVSKPIDDPKVNVTKTKKNVSGLFLKDADFKNTFHKNYCSLPPGTYKFGIFISKKGKTFMNLSQKQIDI